MLKARYNLKPTGFSLNEIDEEEPQEKHLFDMPFLFNFKS